MTVKTVEIDGKELFILTREAFDELMEKAGVMPPLPPAAADGSRLAVPFAKASIARRFVRRRIAAGLTQRELAKRAGVRGETISRLEAGKHVPTEETLLRIDNALKLAAKRGKGRSVERGT
jgi:DNA-binding XRE family transcriptional regulator